MILARTIKDILRLGNRTRSTMIWKTRVNDIVIGVFNVYSVSILS